MEIYRTGMGAVINANINVGIPTSHTCKYVMMAIETTAMGAAISAGSNVEMVV